MSHEVSVDPESWGEWVGASELRSWELDTDAVVIRFYEILEEINDRDGDFYGVYLDHMRIAPDAEKYNMKPIKVDYSKSAGLLGFCVSHRLAQASTHVLTQLAGGSTIELLEPELVTI